MKHFIFAVLGVSLASSLQLHLASTDDEVESLFKACDKNKDDIVNTIEELQCGQNLVDRP